ncbi:AMP-binding protein [Solimonas flava]|uniref:AMP-binding protein n=1 Tax=Solimonas flava TaxID=415849 RepID=UPI0003FEA76D|nr:AMP-binding protein [Solimonas flava]
MGLTLAESDLPLQRLYRWERERAERIYLTQPLGGGAVRDYRWREAMDEARRIAAFLRAQQWPAGSRVTILSKNCAHWLLADFAIWMAGHVSVPIYPTLAADSIRQILDHAEARAIFIGKLDDWAAMAPGVPETMPRIRLPLAPPRLDGEPAGESWDALLARYAPIADSPTRPADDLATIVYTSGTTGAPKGAMHAFANVAGCAKVMGETFGFSSEERILSYLPLAHVAERIGVEANSVRQGFRVYFADSLDSFVADLQRARPTLFFSVPRLWVKFQQGVFAKLPKAKLDRLCRVPLLGRLVKRKILRQLGLDAVHFAATGAAPLPPAVIEWYRGLGLDLLEVYGMTENFGLSHTSRPQTMRVGYVGTPWPHVECLISAQGEVLVRAPWLMQGYFRDPQRSAEAIDADGWLHTGDVGEIDEIGRLKITGRAKEQFKTSKGKYVAPAPIENRLGAHPRIEAVCVAGAEQPQPFALVMLPAELSQAADADADLRATLDAELRSLRETVNARLDPHERLEFLTVVREQWTIDNGFLTPTMKIRRAQLEDRYAPEVPRWQARREPVVWD